MHEPWAASGRVVERINLIGARANCRYRYRYRSATSNFALAQNATSAYAHQEQLGRKR